MDETALSERTETYLRTIYDLATSAEIPVPISTLANQLDVSNVSATETVHRLEEKQLLVHHPYKGVVLTAEGTRIALTRIRHHHLWECFLTDELGLPLEQVATAASKLQHATTSAVAEALSAHLNHPTCCPHGQPIPTVTELSDVA